MVVALDKPRRAMHAALETGAEAFDAVCMALAQHRLLHRPPRWHRLGDQGFPAEPWGACGDVSSLARAAGSVERMGLLTRF